MLLFHGNLCVFWSATCVGLDHDTDKLRENLAIGDKSYFLDRDLAVRLFQVLMYTGSITQFTLFSKVLNSVPLRSSKYRK